MLNLLTDGGKSKKFFHNVKSKVMMPFINFAYIDNISQQAHQSVIPE